MSGPDESVGSVAEEAAKLLHALQETSPEVRQHLTTAGTSLLHAAAGLLATTVPEPSKQRRDGPVEKIDLSDDDWEDD